MMYEWVELCLSNKNGNGDQTGRLPAEALTFTSQFFSPRLPRLIAPSRTVLTSVSRLCTDDYYFASSDRDKERQAIFASAFQQRCESSARRHPPPQRVPARVLTRGKMVADGAGHSGHDLAHLTHWLADPPLPAEDLAAIKVPIMILAGELDQVRERLPRL